MFLPISVDWYVKDLPLGRLAVGEVLIAYELNGAPLRVEHGFPAWLVVPGYYGTNSVKWLWRLHLAEQRAERLFTTVLYNDVSGSVWALAPESIIVAPAPDSVVAVDKVVEIWGWAWSERGVATVEVSVDGGASLTRAALDERRGRAWQRFSLPRRPVDRGQALPCVRASEASGTGRPCEGARNSIHSAQIAVA